MEPEKSKKEEITTSFIDRLKQLRMLKGFSQIKFADKLGLDHTQYNKYETGVRKPSIETLSKLAEALEVTVDYLLEGEETVATVINFKDKELLHMFSEIENLPKIKQQAVKIILNAVIKEEKLQQLAI